MYEGGGRVRREREREIKVGAERDRWGKKEQYRESVCEREREIERERERERERGRERERSGGMRFKANCLTLAIKRDGV
jgi:hypothetical protein